MPTADAFADPAGFARSESTATEGDAMDAALRDLLDEEARDSDDGDA